MVLPNRSGRSVVAGPTIRSAAAPDRTTVTREVRSEEHTSELQSRQYLVCRLLLEKKKENVRGPTKRVTAWESSTTTTAPSVDGRGKTSTAFSAESEPTSPRPLLTRSTQPRLSDVT